MYNNINLWGRVTPHRGWSWVRNLKREGGSAVSHVGREGVHMSCSEVTRSLEEGARESCLVREERGG